MPDLIAKPALGRAPLTRAGLALAEGKPGRITSIAPFPRQAAAVSAALAPLGLAFPGPNESLAAGVARILWTGREQAFLLGAEPPAGLDAHAALTDQGDGWACLALTGAGADQVLMRLVPVDLRPSAFPVGRCIRAPLNHMSMILTRTEAGFEIFVFRSMARTAWHEIEEVLSVLEARAALA